MLHNLSNNHSIVNQFIGEIRDVEIQKDRLRFRRNMERIGEIFAYEISKTMEFTTREVTTPLGIADVPVLVEQPVVATILRAGLPVQHGIMNIFDQADAAFISAYRRHHKDGTFDIKLEYISSPSLDNRFLILCDPMVATGASLVKTYKALIERGVPQHIHIVSVLCSSQGVDFVRRNLPSNITIWTGAIDEELTAQAYIVPGLGDAGDLAFGVKL
jgi:uracil phosphoribosyltransferase